MKKYLLSIAVALGALALSSCSEDKFEAGPVSQGAYFSADTPSTIEFLDTDNHINVTVCRTDASAAETVPVAFSDESGLFTAPAQVNFAAGEKTADYTISFDPAQIGDTPYPVTLAIGGQGYTYAPTTLNINLYMNMWVDAGQGVFQNDLLAVFGMAPGAYYVPVKKYVGNAKRVRVMNPFLIGASNVPEDFQFTAISPTYITINYDDPDAIYMEYSELGQLDLNPYVGEAVMSVFAFYQMRQGITVEQGKAAGLFTVTMSANGIISFPAGELIIQLDDGTGSGYYNTGQNGQTKLKLPASLL